ncbi:MAG TPA: DUF4760 domain-containing protein [Magnetospirillaceae bacterium]|jgi:hypothetical protein
MRHVRIRYLVYISVAIAAALGLRFAMLDSVAPGGPHYLEALSFSGAMLVATGWIVTNEVSIRNLRKQHTITLISDFLIRKERIEDKKLIKTKLPKLALITSIAGLDYGDDNNDLLQAIDRELNFYEFIAVGLKNGDLDGRISYDIVRGLLVGFITQVHPYIDYWRVKDPETWEHAVQLADKWKLKRSS